ncbi:S6OS1 protein, partial [Spelaeornis formosus]|nr:S6OS1 protein [Elachura formosa]
KTMQEHRKKYTETALSQKYYQKKKEVEEIQNRVLERLEKYKWKEDASLDMLGTAIANAFTKCLLAVHCTLKKTLQLAEAAAQETAKQDKEAEELQMKINCLKKAIKEAEENQNNLKKIEEKNQKSLEKPEEVKKSVLEEREHPSLPKEKHQLFKTLSVPCIPWKVVQSVQSFRSSKQRPETGREEKQKPVELTVATSSSSSPEENLSQ